VQEVTQFCQRNPHAAYTAVVQQQLQSWIALTTELGMKALQNPDEVNAAAYDYLMFAGYTVLAWIWADAARVASAALETAPAGPEREFYTGKLVTARFYFERLLPRTLALAASLRSGVANLPQFPALD